jgi:surface antigen
MTAKLAAVIVLVAIAASAQAQAPFGSNRNVALPRGDLDRLNAAVAQVTNQPVGTKQDWRNPANGDSGTVQLIGTTQRRGLPCLTLRHVIKEYGKSQPTSYVVNRCRLPDGQWKLD